MRVNRRLMHLVSDKRAQRAGLLALLWLPALAILLVVREVLLPFLLAFALAYVIAPPVRWLSRRQVGGRSIPRWAAVLLLYFVTAFVVFIGGRIFVPQLYKELTRLGGEASWAFHGLSDDRIAEKANELEAWIQRNDLPIHIVTAEDDEGAVSGVWTGPAMAEMSATKPVAPTVRSASSPGFSVDLVAATQELIRDGKKMARDRAIAAVTQVQAVVTGAVRLAFATLLVLMLTAFIVADTERMQTFVFTITPVRDRAKLQTLLERIDHGLSGVVRGQLTICMINGVLTLVGLLLLKVKFAFLLATVAAVFSLIPIFGSILSTIPIVIVGLSSGASTAVLAVLWIVGIHALEANLLNPKIMGDAAKIHPVLVVLALVIGEHFYGLAGALFAVPLMSVMVTIWKAVRARAMVLDEELASAETTSPTMATSATATHRRLRATDGG
jgi:predicted PurR-regulated permease PerM